MQMNIYDQINREIGAHGDQWDSMHDGYFSDAAVASPFIATITKYLSESDIDAVVDLGGGTGFILRELIAKGLTKNIIPVNMDCSSTQLNAMGRSGICCINRLISEFNRSDLFPFGERFFFIMRSVLHYFGKDGLIPVLQHIRNQAQTGEMFIHQTACFENRADAQCLNALYREMGTPKWYPLVNELRDKMAKANWKIMDMFTAPPLKLLSAELGQRYGLDAQALMKIRGTLLDEFGSSRNVFQPTSDGFAVYLHYYICVARAAR
jgi:hypothetical protein